MSRDFDISLKYMKNGRMAFVLFWLKLSDVMDVALWDPSDYQDENNYYNDDYWHCDFYSGYGHDAIEEDALNEKSCVQVLGILVNKADEEIMELEADASLKKEIAGDENFLSVELLKNKKRAERLHDIVKPLWNSCFQLIQKQTEIMIIQRSIPPADELRKLMYRSKHRKLKAKKNFALMKNNEFQDPKAKSSADKLATRNSEEKALSNFKFVGCSIEVPEKIIRPLPGKPAQKADMEIRDKEGDGANSFVNAHTYATEKNINHLNGQSGTQKPSSAPDKVKKRRNPTKSEKLQNALVKDSSASTYGEKAGSKGRKKRRNIDLEVIFEEQVIECSFTDKSKVLNSSLESPGMGTKIAEMVKPADTILDSRLDALKQVTEDSSCIQKARRKEVADMKKIDSRTQLQKEGKRTNVCGRTKISGARAAETELTISEHTS
ncbi:Uncharacterized protein Adt_41854 [Abeliophyllum distichum]|uniref:Uncharacterized protein n=1 Tax=Abeliophyllum distichum TaxID=126358 RepID=A0ABD1PQ11_9LAMI